MRKAISFSGQSRFVLEGLESLRKNLHNFEEYDIFIPLKFRKKTEESKIFFKILSYDKTEISQEEFEYLLKK